VSQDVKSNDRDTSVDWFVSLSVGDLVRSLWSFRVSIVLWSIALACLLAVVVFLLPVKYDSDAQLLVRLGRNTLSVDPTSNITPTVSVQETRLSQVNSVKEMLQSRTLVEQIVERVGADRILQPHGLVEEQLDKLSKWVSAQAKTGAGRFNEAMGVGDRVGIVDDAVDSADSLSPEETAQHLKHEEAIAKLEDSIQITTAKNAYTIHVRIRSGSPYLSRDLLRALIELYQQHHVNAYHSDGTLPFFEEQTSQAYDSAVAAKEKVRQAKNTMGVIEIESARLALREQLTQARRELDQVDSDLAATSSEVQRYEIEMKALPERVQAETVTGITSNKSDGMRQQLYQLEVQVKELSSKLRDDHPQLKAIRDQLAAATVIAEQERKEQPQNREAINPVYQQLELAYRNSLVRRDGLQAKRESLKKHLADLDKEIVELNQDELELTKLSWEATLAENVYLENAQSRNKAKLIAALDREGLSELSVVQPASLQLKKSSPKRGLLLVAAALLAGGLAVFQALVRTVVSRAPQADSPRPERRPVEEFDLSPRAAAENRTEEAGDASEVEEREYALHVK
jgi:uncharacterized protein involved in exopolysaccharide biosynthesis